MEYIEFGRKHDVVWILEPISKDPLVKALEVRGFSDVRAHTPIPGDAAQSVWEENQYLPQPYDEWNLPNRPEAVHVIRRQGSPSETGSPVAASTSKEIADKVAEAMRFTFPMWTVTVEETAPPE